MKHNKIFGFLLLIMLVMVVGLFYTNSRPVMADTTQNLSLTYVTAINRGPNGEGNQLCINVSGGTYANITVTYKQDPGNLAVAPKLTTAEKKQKNCETGFLTGYIYDATGNDSNGDCNQNDTINITAKDGNSSGSGKVSLCAKGLDVLYKTNALALVAGQANDTVSVQVNVTYLISSCGTTVTTGGCAARQISQADGNLASATLTPESGNGGVINFSSWSTGVVNFTAVPVPGTYKLAIIFTTSQPAGQEYEIALNETTTYTINDTKKNPYVIDGIILGNSPGQSAPTSITTAPTGSGGDVNAPPACESSGFNLSWAICPIINAIGDGEELMENDLINPMLKTQPLQLNVSDTCLKDDTNCTAYDNLYKVWSQFRIYGDVLLVIALLVVIFAEALGGGAIDAYTIRKMLPRILIAAILINLSIYIVAALEDITNILGSGVYDLISAPFKASADWKMTINGPTADFSGFAGLAAAGGAIWAVTHAATAIPIILLFVGLPVLLIFLSIVFTLLIRQAILAFCIITSPIAFVLFCLPNTEQYFRKWFNLLIKTLMVYPIVELVMVMAGVAGVIVSSINGWSGQLLGVVAKIAPLALIPFAFKLSGGVISQTYSGATNLGKKLSEGIKGNPNNPYSLRNRVKRDALEDVTRSQQRVVDKGKSLDASKRRKAFSRVVSMTGGNIEGRMSRYNKELAEMAETMSATGRDRLRYAAAGYILEAGEADSTGHAEPNRRRYMNSKGDEISANEYQQGKSLFGQGLGNIGSQLEYTTRKAQSDKDIANMRFAYAKNAKSGGWNADEMRDVWAQAVFPHKDKWLSEWYSTPVPLAGNSASQGVRFEDVSTNMNSLDKEINEQHRTKEGFRVSSLRAQDWAAQHHEMMRIQSKLDIDPNSATKEEVERYAKMSENLDTMARSGIITMNGEGEPQVSGAPAEAQGEILAMFNSRKYLSAPKELPPTPLPAGVAGPPAPSGTYSGSDRILYDKAVADQLSSAAPPGGGRPLTRLQAINAAALKNKTTGEDITAHVASDRVPITRNTVVH